MLNRDRAFWIIHDFLGSGEISEKDEKFLNKNIKYFEIPVFIRRH